LARQWIAAGWVHVMASDAHNMTWRPPSMKAGYASVQREFGKETADRLCVHNPSAIFFDRTMPEQPEPKETLKARKSGGYGIFSRILGYK
jgi:protein-tyrosine phosphatase